MPFSEFTLSPQRRLLVREGREVPLIPRYFDLLLLLIERRHEAVHRREIFDRVWTDVIAMHTAEAGFAASRGGRRLRSALIIAVLCGLAGMSLSFAGRPLVGGTIHAIADGADGSRATLAPLGRLLGEPDFGPLSRTILAFGEAATFGLGLVSGSQRRPHDGR